MIRKAWRVGLLRFVILLLLFMSAVWIIGKRFAATEIPRLYAAEIETVVGELGREKEAPHSKANGGTANIVRHGIAPDL